MKQRKYIIPLQSMIFKDKTAELKKEVIAKQKKLVKVNQKLENKIKVLKIHY